MEPKQKINLLQKALNQLIEEERGSTEDRFPVADAGGAGGENTPLLLSKLLSQLDSLKEDTGPVKSEMSAAANEAISKEEIVEELREVKKQNSRTHWLLSLMIALTLAWQLSEVSIILKLKQRLTNPFKSIGNVIKGIFKGGSSLNEQEMERDAASKNKQIPQIYSFPGLKAPEIPHAGLSNEDG